MIIKSHIRGGFRDAAAYLKEQGENENTRLVEMSDAHVKNLDEAFRAMWSVASGTQVKKPLHHVSINPMKDERLTDQQVGRICERLEEQYGYAHGQHQRVIVEHVKDGRQHFHVIWNRVSLKTGKPHYPYMHKKQSKITAREMEVELGLKKPVRRKKTTDKDRGRAKGEGRTHSLNPAPRTTIAKLHRQRPTINPSIRRSLTSRGLKVQSRENPIRPFKSTKTGSMCIEQSLDYAAACEGKITWARYFQKWGGSGGNNHVCG